MPLELNDGTARFVGHVDIVEAEALQDWLRQHEAPEVDVAQAGHAHMAILQLLLAARPRIVGDAAGPGWVRLLDGALRPAATTEG